MYQPKGNEVLIRQIMITKAAANMAGLGYLVQPNVYRDKLWRKDDPQRSAILEGVRDLAQQCAPKPLHGTIVSPFIGSTVNKSTPMLWSSMWDDQPSYSNRVLADEILPATLAVCRSCEGHDEEFNWSQPSDLPLPVLKWVHGSR